MLGAIAKRDSPIFPSHNTWLWYFVILFALPVTAIFLGQSGRQEYAGHDYDSPARFLLSIPILLVLFHQRCDMLKFLVYTIPAATFITFTVVMLNPNDVWQPQANIRASRHFVDPLTFGSLNLTLGLCCLLSIDLYGRDAWGVRLYKSAGFIIGVYLSVLSGSRTGWLALPLVLFLWLNFRMTRYRVPAIIIVLLLTGGSYYFSTTLQQRLDLAEQQILSYHWDAPNPQTSVGDRVSFLRMAVFLFTQHPWSGFGDQGFVGFINHPELNRYAIQKTQEFALRSGFHNEIATNMVRSGVWGLLSSSALFLMPAVFFIRSLFEASPQSKKIALLALGYLVCTFISGMTTEVFNLKFTASFHALMFTCLISSLLIHHSGGQSTERNESA
jgi:O-antigen ligase